MARDRLIRERVLIISSLAPFPARANGFSIRYAPIIRHLSVARDVHVALIDTGLLDASQLQCTASEVASLSVFQRPAQSPSVPQRLRSRLVSLIPGTTPHPVVHHFSREVTEFLSRCVDEIDPDVIVLTMVDRIHEIRLVNRRARLVVDAIDAWSTYLARSAGGSALRRYDAWRTRQWERQLPDRCDALTYISEADMLDVHGGAQLNAKLSVIPNGVSDHDLEPNVLVDRDPFRLCFLGHMGYEPNVEAAVQLASLMPAIRERVPLATLTIIGRSPAERVLKLASVIGVRVTGTVDSIWPELQRCSVGCFPMRSGAGQQNKLLEAMMAGCAVVTTAIGNRGVLGRDREHLLVRNTNQEIVDSVVDLLTHPKMARALGEAGRSFVKAKYDWNAQFRLIDRLWFDER